MIIVLYWHCIAATVNMASSICSEQFCFKSLYGVIQSWFPWKWLLLVLLFRNSPFLLCYIQGFQPGGRNSEIKWRTAGSIKRQYKYSVQALHCNFRTRASYTRCVCFAGIYNVLCVNVLGLSNGLRWCIRFAWYRMGHCTYSHMLWCNTSWFLL